MSHLLNKINLKEESNPRGKRIILITVFTLMIIAGIYNDEASVVLKKAANICLECIGLGG